ncbi:hypothetical protein BWI17_00650 [Betaproteobacteria bacterium GR16-43]|nr:hypothetical protein BWI17_00650 [Betaproteobacteria bacterium GR16-43]
MSYASSQPFPDKAAKPFSLWRIPNYTIPVEVLVTDSDEKTQSHVDVLGCQLFQSRNDILETLKALAEDASYRSKLGAVKAREVEALSKLSAPDREAALAVAELAMNRLIEQFAGTLAVGHRAYPGNHCIEYRIDSEVLRIIGATADGPKFKKLGQCSISADSSSPLAASFGRWLNKFGRWSKHV